MLTAVWMHLDEAQRRQAMPNLAALMRPGGTMIMKIRHGPVPPGRQMFEVSAEDTIALAGNEGLRPVLNVRSAWFIDIDSAMPRFVTAHPLPKR